MHRDDRRRSGDRIEQAGLPARGRALPWGWWTKSFEPGTALLWRQQVQERRSQLRQLGRLKHDPDRRIAKERRRAAVSLFNWMTAEQDDPLPRRSFAAKFGDLGTSSRH